MNGYRYLSKLPGKTNGATWIHRSGSDPLSIVIDTDTYNEIDDQYALAYAMLASDRLKVDAVYAAPFHNARSAGPEDGMLRSYDEVLRVIDAVKPLQPPSVFRGASAFLASEHRPRPSDAVDDLIARARSAAAHAPLVVVGIAALTNIASALLQAPDIASRVVVVWLGGHPYDWPNPDEFNLTQDVAAARAVFASDVRLVHLPCKNVSEHLRITRHEVEARLMGRGPIGDYLHAIFEEYHPPVCTWSKVIWDIAPIGWLIDPAWVSTVASARPVLDETRAWRMCPERNGITRVGMDVHRDAIYNDLFSRIEAHAAAVGLASPETRIVSESAASLIGSPTVHP